MSGEGLTRRRGGAGSPAVASSATFDSAPAATPTSSRAPTSSVEGRSKVAFDPRDFEDTGEATKMPRLTLMEEILLIGLKDKAVGRNVCSTDDRAIYPFGMTTFPTLFEDAS